VGGAAVQEPAAGELAVKLVSELGFGHRWLPPRLFFVEGIGASSQYWLSPQLFKKWVFVFLVSLLFLFLVSI